MTAGHAGRALTALALRQVRRGTLVVLATVAAVSAFVVSEFRSTFSSALSLSSMQALADNPAIRVLFGRPVAIGDPGGFTVWRTGMFAAVLVGVWALLAATRICRGEEDAGRWDLLLAGASSRRGALARHLLVVVAAPLLVGAGAAAAMLLTGTKPSGALLYGAGLGLAGSFFAATGGLTSQLMANRRAAAGLAAGVLGVGLLLRMAADGVEWLQWLRWLSPFGLLAASEPYGVARVGPLLVLALATVAAGFAALAICERRDLGAGVFSTRDTRVARMRSLRSLPRFAARRLLRSSLAWGVGITAYFLLIGLLAVSVTQFLTDNPQLVRQAAQAGLSGLGSVEGYVSAVFSLLAVPTSLYVASQLAATSTDEGARRLTLLFALPVARLRWLGAYGSVVLAAAALLTAAAGLATWLGTVLVGASLGVGAALAGALNTLPVVAVSLGAAVLALGWLPEAVFAIGSLPAVAGFLVQSLADGFGWPDWVAGLSPFSHLAAVPSVGVDWAGAASLVLVGALLACVGAVGYAHRDLRG